MDSIMLAASTARMALNFIELSLSAPQTMPSAGSRASPDRSFLAQLHHKITVRKFQNAKNHANFAKFEKYLLVSTAKAQQEQKIPGMFGKHSGLTKLRRKKLSVIAARCQRSRKGELFASVRQAVQAPLGGAGKAARL